MYKKIIAFLLSLCFCFTIIQVSAVETVVTVAFEESEIIVEEHARLIINLSSDITKFSAHIAYNNRFIHYSGTGVGYDKASMEYTLDLKGSTGPHIVTCYSSNTGTTAITLKNITYETAEGTFKLDDISVKILITPKYTKIYTKEDLNNIRNDLSGNYKLMKDITFTEEDFSEGGDFYNDGFGWIPIGAVQKTPFSGEFNGNGHTISGLKINKAYYNYCGLFGVSKGTIRNLRMTDADIDGKIGINVSSEGLPGYTPGGDVDYEDKDTWTEPDDTLTEEDLNKYDRTSHSTANLGIICGFNLGSINRSYCSGTITGNMAVGGIAGRNNGSIHLCATDAEVSSRRVAGGIAGVTGAYSVISDVVTEGSVDGLVAGGLVGNASGSVNRACVLVDVISDKALASFGIASTVTVTEVYAFGNLNPDGKTEIKEMTELVSLRFTEGEWTYTSRMPYPTPIADLVKIVIFGDADGDGNVNTTDLAVMKLFLAGVGEVDENGADLNGDKKVTTTDLASLKLLLAGAQG